MPIPILLAGVGVAAGLLGVGGHMCAKEDNEEAQEIIRKSQEKYEKAQSELDKAKEDCIKSLESLGLEKKKVLDTSITDFLNVYEKVKSVNVKKTVGINELKGFDVKKEDVADLQKMCNIYGGCISSSVAGVATGALVSLAASGMLPMVASEIGWVGSMAAIGEFGVAAEFLGEAATLGAAATPLAAIAVPVVFFTGISASMKADENLEKAKANRAEVNVAVEKIKTSETLCHAIRKRSELFEELLIRLDGYFSEDIEKLSSRIKQIEKNKKIKISDLTEGDIQLIAETRALAGAVKAVIDTPIITKDGQLTEESEVLISKTENIVKNSGCDKDVNTKQKEKIIETNKASEEEGRSSRFNEAGFGKTYMAVLSYEGKVKKICEKMRRELEEKYKGAPEKLIKQPIEQEIKLSEWQMIGNASRDSLFEARKRALKRSDLTDEGKRQVEKNIDELEKVITDSVKLLAKDKFATKSEIKEMQDRLVEAEKKITYKDEVSSFTI